MAMYKITKSHKILAVLVTLCFLVGLLPLAAPSAHAFNLGFLGLGGALGDLLNIFGVGWIVQRFGPEINNSINNFLGQRNLGIEGMTKVVPILNVSLSGGSAVGAAQVMGPEVQVQKVQAVAQMEWEPTDFRGRVLVPLATGKAFASDIQAVDGVGISAVVEFPIH
jgi:hypothetical protein